MTYIHPTAIIYPNVLIGVDVYIGAYCIIGAPPESIDKWGDGLGVRIGSGTKITGHVTIDSGIERKTEIGMDCFIMKGCHVGHDAIVGNKVVMSPHSILGGYCSVGDMTNFGIASVVHQRLSVPDRCMIGMNTTITKQTNMESNGVYVGSPARWIRHNNR